MSCFYSFRRFPSACRNFSSSFHPSSSRPSNGQSLWFWGNTSLASTVMSSSRSATPTQEPLKMPRRISGFTNIGPMAAGPDHTAFVADGRLFSFGSNQYGQLGRTLSDKDDGNQPGEIDLDPRHRVVGVACGSYHTVAVTEEGLMFSWGWGGSFWSGVGGLGHGNNLSVESPKLVQCLAELQEAVVQVACGQQHTLALTDSGDIYACGKGELGRLGRGHNGDQEEFMKIELFSGLKDSEAVRIIKIDCGTSHSTALGDNGSVWVWGRNDYGQLGLDDCVGDVYANEMYPRRLRSFDLENIRIRDISCGDHHMVAISDKGVIYIWGGRAWLTPRAVTMNPSYANNPIVGHVSKVEGGGGHHHYSMAITDDGKLYSWGKPGSRCLAREVSGNANEPSLVDPEVFDNELVVDVECGRYRVLASTVPQQ
eukprot:GHVS01052943.1.p1 GENE.GHVS01052943.1~~GHVS01052943.1.p1  ORF type:complete len:425 (-),score=32.07 GHVS01052943.1:115-1389(-)